jgi:quinol monooxygenase YgiN
MTISTQHHHVTLTAQPAKASETRELLAQCAQRVTPKKSENGPVNWCASAGDDDGVFFVDALFENQGAVDFHAANIADIVANFGPLMAAPPQTIITAVIVSAN